MPTSELKIYPFLFEPIYQHYVWGGHQICKTYPSKKNVSEPVAESWEISDREEGKSILLNGPLKGKSLSELMSLFQEDLMGRGKRFNHFPLLIKIIDAKQNLSIQVHPDENLAKKLKAEAKNEMWFALEDSQVLAGFKKKIEIEEFKEAVLAKKAEHLLKAFSLKKGEALFIPGGRVHAICASSFIYEVQQNSNTTYRLYDWGRTSRELHLKEGLQAMNLDDPEAFVGSSKILEEKDSFSLLSVLKTPFFIVQKAFVKSFWQVKENPHTFQIFFLKEGNGSIEANGVEEPFLKGMTYLVGAAAKKVIIRGPCEVIQAFLP